MTRKLEKGEELKVGDVIELVNGGIGAVSKLGTDAFWVHWNGRAGTSEEGYSLFDPIVQGAIATAVITREMKKLRYVYEDHMVNEAGALVPYKEGYIVVRDNLKNFSVCMMHPIGPHNSTPKVHAAMLVAARAFCKAMEEECGCTI